MKKVYTLLAIASVALSAAAAPPTTFTGQVSSMKPAKSVAYHSVSGTSARKLVKAPSQSRSGEEFEFKTVEDFEGNYIWDFGNFLTGKYETQELSIKVTDAAKGEVEIHGMTIAGLNYNPIKAVVDITAGTFSIPNTQYLGEYDEGSPDYFYVKVDDEETGDFADGNSDLKATVGTIVGGDISFPDDEYWAVGNPDNEVLGFWVLSGFNVFSIIPAPDEPIDPMEGWEVYCTGKLQDGWICPGFGVDPAGTFFDVEIHRSTTTPGVYRLYNPYMSDGFQFKDYASEGSIVFDISDKEFVSVLYNFNSGVYNGSSAIGCTNIEGYFVNQGYDKEVITAVLGYSEENPEGIKEWSTYDENEKMVSIPTARISLAGQGNYVWTDAESIMVSKIIFDKAPVEYPEPVVVTPVVTLDQTEATINIGETIKLTVTIENPLQTDEAVTWTSSDEAVATVNSEGVVTGFGEGTATITATCGEATATCTVTVEKGEEPVNPVEVEVGAIYTLETVTFTSSNEAVATVDADGVVTGVAAGKAIITATYAGVSTLYTVTVIDGDVNTLDEIEAAASSTEVEVYDLQGRKVGAATKGIVIIRQGNKAIKTIVK